MPPLYINRYRVLAELARTVADNHVDNDGLLAILGLELLLHFALEGIYEFVSHEVDGATAEATAHDTGTRDTHFLGHVVEEVELFAAYFILLAQAIVGFVHHLAYHFVVVVFECIADCQHALYFANDVAGTLVLVAGNATLYFIEHFHGSVAQAFHFGMGLLDNLSHVLALQTALVVGRTSKYVLHTAVDKDELVAFGIPGEICVLTAAAVEAHEAALATEYGGELVHNAAVATHVLVLGALAYASQFHLLNLVLAPQVVEREGVSAFEGSRGGHASTEGYVTCKGSVEAFYGNTEGHHLAAHAEDVACPCGFGTCLIVERELHVVLQVDGVGAYVAGAVGLDFGNHSLLYGTGEYEAVVIVGVFADEVDTTGAGINAAGFAIEMLDKT